MKHKKWRFLMDRLSSLSRLEEGSLPEAAGTSSVYRTTSSLSTASQQGQDVPSRDSLREAAATLRENLGTLQKALQGLREQMEELQDVAAVNQGKIPDVNALVQEVLDQKEEST